MQAQGRNFGSKNKVISLYPPWLDLASPKGVTTPNFYGIEGLPLSLVLVPGNEYDSKRFTETLTEIKIYGMGEGRPRSKPIEVLADAAYDEKEIRHSFEEEE
jgi:hypothetical protein